MAHQVDGINPGVKPSGAGCEECTAEHGWWLHLRRCAQCGHIGCCDNSPKRHATAHFQSSRHPIIASFEPGEAWFYDYRTEEFATRTDSGCTAVASRRPAGTGTRWAGPE